LKKSAIIVLALALCLSIAGCGRLLNAVKEGVEEGISSALSSMEPVISDLQETDEYPEDEKPDEPVTTTPKESSDEVAYEITYAKATTYGYSMGIVWVQSIFVVENTGSTRLYLSGGAFDLEDENGKLVKSVASVPVYPNVIDPGEKAYYHDKRMLESLDNAEELVILPRVDIKKATVDTLRLSVSDLDLVEEGYSGVKMRGRVENTTDEEQTLVYIATVLFDDSDIPIGLMVTTLSETLAPGDKVGFETSGYNLPKNLTVDSVSRYEVFAYHHQFQY